MDNKGKTHMFAGSDTAFYLNPVAPPQNIGEINQKVVDKKAEMMEKNVQSQLQTAREMDEFLSGARIKPVNNYVLIKPCKKNPFKVMRMTKSGIVISPFGGTFTNPDTGEEDRMESVEEVAEVVDPGNYSEMCKAGDYVFYSRRSSNEIPFMEKGYEALAYQNIHCVVEKLK